jgi:hypothetical protein
LAAAIHQRHIYLCEPINFTIRHFTDRKHFSLFHHLLVVVVVDVDVIDEHVTVCKDRANDDGILRRMANSQKPGRCYELK